MTNGCNQYEEMPNNMIIIKALAFIEIGPDGIEQTSGYDPKQKIYRGIIQDGFYDKYCKPSHYHIEKSGETFIFVVIPISEYFIACPYNYTNPDDHHGNNP